jgi:uncharacterized protein (TIGR04255 family)
MAQSRPKFEVPPVVETVLSVQFANLPGYSTAHAGWFWKEYLEKLAEGSSLKWSQAVDAPRLEDQFERFGADDKWVGPQVRLLPPSQSQRTQIIRSDNERMIQVQDSRFILNWKKQAGVYPSFEPLLDEFRTMLQAFETFAIEAGFGTLGYNQWELAYVDHLKKGEMWESARDWSKILPGLSMPPVQQNQLLSAGEEVLSADWRFSLANQCGRMYIQLRQARIPPSNQEVLSLTWVARGPVTAAETWDKGFALGHDAISETFLAIISPEAQARWKKGA